MAVFGAAIALWFGFPAYRQYTWADRVAKEASGSGWTAVGTINNYINLSSPWSLVRPPPVSAAFVRRDDARVTDDGKLVVRFLLARNTSLAETNDEGYQGWLVLDCDGRRFASVSEADKSLDELRWTVAGKDMPGSLALDFACRNYR